MDPPRVMRSPALVWVAVSTLASLGCPTQPDSGSSSAGSERSGRKPESSSASAEVAPIPSATSSAANGREASSTGNDVEPRADAASQKGSRAPEPVGGPWVTCYGNYRPSSTPERDVTRLGLLCGPANGMRMEGATITGEATESATEHVVDVRAGECLRIFVVAEASAPDLAVEVRNPKGVPIASDHNNDRWPILNPDGPFCLLDAGKHTVRVHARQGRGKYALQIWRLP